MKKIDEESRNTKKSQAAWRRMYQATCLFLPRQTNLVTGGKIINLVFPLKVELSRSYPFPK